MTKNPKQSSVEVQGVKNRKFLINHLLKAKNNPLQDLKIRILFQWVKSRKKEELIQDHLGKLNSLANLNLFSVKEMKTHCQNHLIVFITKDWWEFMPY